MMSQHTKGEEENRRNSKYIADIKKKIEIVFVTDSLYDNKEDE